MDTILYNVSWMSFNVFLAIIPIFFGWLMLKTRFTILRILFGFVWLIFLPNTIYMLTDIIHLPHAFAHLSGTYRIIVTIQYALLMVIAVITYVVGFHPLERVFEKVKGKKKIIETDALLFIINILIAFGMTLGRFQRTNSWDVVTNPQRVIEDGLHVFASVKLFTVFLLFTLLCNALYFSLRKLEVVLWVFDVHYGKRKKRKKR